MEFTLNKKAAIDADKNSGMYIKESGPYVGQFTKVWEYHAKSGAVMLNFEFESDQGEKTGRMGLCVQKKDGGHALGADMVQSLMACLKVKSAKPVQKGNETIYPDLMNKQIGVIMQAENDGQYINMNIKHFFNWETKQFGSEIMEQKPAEKYEKMAHYYTEKEVIPYNTGGQQSVPQSYNETVNDIAGSMPEIDDSDVPF